MFSTCKTCEIAHCGNLTYLYSIYGIDGVIGFITNGGYYYYIKNPQGDVTKIANFQNDIVAEYEYDAWGNCTIKTGYDGGMDTINPIRYRSYYYDEETGLYYLNSRYYDPEIGRFISPDSTKYLDPESINGLNLYAYCLNNPVMYADPNGNVALSIGLLIAISFGLGTAIGVGSSVVSQGIDNGFDNINWWQVGFDGLIGGIGGAFAMSGFNTVALGLISGGLGFVGGVGDAFLNGDSFGDWQTWASIATATIIGGIAGLVGGAGARNAKYLNSATKTTEFLKAATSYDKVLTKIATGGYKNLAGAAGARFLTGNALNIAWNNMVVSQVSRALIKSLIRTGVVTIGLNIGCSVLNNYWGGRGRTFKSCHSDQNRRFITNLRIFFILRAFSGFWLSAPPRKRPLFFCSKSFQK